MERLYADVEYCGSVYLDAELIQDNWYCEDPPGAVHPFTVQHLVYPVNTPQVIRRHPDLGQREGGNRKKPEGLPR